MWRERTDKRDINFYERSSYVHSIGCIKLRRYATMYGGTYSIGCIKLRRYAHCMEVHIVQGVSNVEGMHNAWMSV